MIIDKLTNSGLYHFENEGIKAAIDFLKETDFSKIEDGKYEIDGENIYYIKTKYLTKQTEEAQLEAHKKYIDVQFVLKGKEKIGYAAFTSQKVFKEYDIENDYMLFDEECDFFKFSEGMFAIFFPEDLHKPGIIVNGAEEVKKVVIKVKV
jgi:YhcH/YjgK/YiaL family protein